jgi:hypothetical protein
MNLPASPDPDPNPDPGPSGEAARIEPAPPVSRQVPSRRMLDEIFGDVLPTITSDERDEQDGRGPGDADRERWYRDNRPPHHG